MEKTSYLKEFDYLLTKAFIPAGYTITTPLALAVPPESSKYQGLIFSIDDKNIAYRKGKITPDRPGAFLALWQRPTLGENQKPIPLSANELDFLFIHVESQTIERINDIAVNIIKSGLFIFPIDLLINKGIVSSANNKGKTGFRVFPPWSQDRGQLGTKQFSASGKKTQHWQLPYFLEIDKNGLLDARKLKHILNTEV